MGDEKHYVAHGYHVWTERTTFESEGQHSEIVVFWPPPIDSHDYVEDYIIESDFNIEE